MRFFKLFALFVIAPLCLAESCLAEGDGHQTLDEAYILAAPPGDPPAGNDPATRPMDQTVNSLRSFFAFNPSSGRSLALIPSGGGPVLQSPGAGGYFDSALHGQRTFFAFDPAFTRDSDPNQIPPKP